MKQRDALLENLDEIESSLNCAREAIVEDNFENFKISMILVLGFVKIIDRLMKPQK